jgi:anti-anti-sigma regulatory factor
LALIDCKGRLVKSDSVFELRDVVMAQKDARIIALDLYDVEAMGGGGLGMLAFLQQWATDHDIQLKLFTPSQPVMEELQRTRETLGLEIANLNEMMSILSRSRRATATPHRQSYVF